LCNENIHLFPGRDLAAKLNLEPDEIIELCLMTLSEVSAKVNSGEILDSKTQLALLQYQLFSMENA